MRYDLLHPKALRAALIEAGEAAPTERQVRRWITGETPIPPWALRAIEQVVGTKKEAAPPEWAERLIERVDEIYARQDTIMTRQGAVGTEMAGRVIEALQSPDLAAWAARIGERLAELPSQSSEVSADQPEGQAPGTGARRGPEPS